jgi:hypothetical protein
MYFYILRIMSENTKTGGIDGDLSNLIKETVASLSTNVNCERATKIQNAVATYVNMFLAEVTNIEPLFKPSELIQVGSYAEGTKILEPDEFDFLVVIEELSKPGAVAIDNDPLKVQGVTHLPSTGYVTLTVADDNLKGKWEKYSENGLLKCFQYSTKHARFGSIFIKGIRKFYEERKAKKVEGSLILITATEIDFVNCPLRMPVVGGISLKMRRAELKTPNVLIHFEYEDLEIGVDVSPAIRYHVIKDCFNPEKCAGTKLSEAILCRESLLLVANRNFDFRATVTEAEVDFIKRIMKKEHKSIYIFLKYINTLFSFKLKDWYPFSSYMLKNICLRHDLNCNTEMRELATCLNNVIEDMKQFCTKIEIPNVVNSDINLAANSLVPEDTKLRDFMMEALTQICNKPKPATTVKDFGELLNQVVEEKALKFQSKYIEKSVP